MDDLLKRLLLEFGVASKHDVSHGRMASATAAELTAALREFLLTLAPLQAFAVVIIDVAQALAPGVLHQLLHLIFDERAMQIILVGQPPLAAALDRGSELGKRASLRLALGPLTADEVGGYVVHRLRVAGMNPRVTFDDGAIARVYALSGGKPRLINLLCERALSAAFTESANVVGAAMIDAAAEELDMAPPAARRGGMARLSSGTILLLLFLAGLAAGAIMFRQDIAALLARLTHH
jgi:general secretion pathway protein A